MLSINLEKVRTNNYKTGHPAPALRIEATNEKFGMDAVFEWDDSMKECWHFTAGVDDDSWEELLAHKVHEGCDCVGWDVKLIWL